MTSVSQFVRYFGIDYSGAETPEASLKGLRVYEASGTASPAEVGPPVGPRKYWSRRGVAEWLVARLNEAVPTLVGIDHGFSFPRHYFKAHGLGQDWGAFLEDFQAHWPTDQDYMYVDFVRDGLHGSGAARSGERRWRRLTEERAGAAKSVFWFDVQGQVAKSTHAGLPWLLYLRRQVRAPLHFWPFDGWEIPAGSSAVVEVYPSLWRGQVSKEGRTADQHDAYVVAEWMRAADRDGRLRECLSPPLNPEERQIATFEGWILGVMEGRSSRATKTVAPSTLKISEGPIEAFPIGVADKLKSYVYRLIDPRNGETFYVGKGKGDRVFAHVRLGRSLEGDDQDNKVKRIREIHVAGLEVGHVIHRHGLDEATAFEVEAALIDAYPGLSNIVAGAGSNDYGPAHAQEIVARYAAPPAVFEHRALLISINRTVTEAPLYEAVRYAWKISRSKAKEAEVILATEQGLIVAAFVADEWLEATAANFPGREGLPGRLGFVGREASDAIKALYLRKRVPDEYRKRGAANPIKYTW